MISGKLRDRCSIVIRNPLYAMRAFWRKLKAYVLFDYFLLGGRAFSPVIIHCEVTHHCNLHCEMCTLYSGREPVASLRSTLEEKPLEKAIYEQFFDEVRRFSPLISIVGGEPLLYKDFREFVHAARLRNLDVCVTTNGVLLDQFAEFLVQEKVHSLNVSLDAPEEIHDALRGKAGTFNLALQGIRKVSDEKRRLHTTVPRIKIAPCITKKNYTFLFELLKILEHEPVDSVSISHLWFWDKTMVQRHHESDSESNLFDLQAQNWQSAEGISPEILSGQIKRIRQARFSFPVNFFPALTDEQIRKYYGNPSLPLKYRCTAPWREAILLPDGKIIPCMDFIFGNIRTEKFSVLWNSQRAIHFRRILRQGKLFTGCLRCCGLFAYP